MLLPVYFLGIVIGFRKRDNFLPVVAVSAVASIVAYRYVGSPWHVSIGALAGVALAALLPPVKSEPRSPTSPVESQRGRDDDAFDPYMIAADPGRCRSLPS